VGEGDGSGVDGTVRDEGGMVTNGAAVEDEDAASS
jgi:hypothetical protein